MDFIEQLPPSSDYSAILIIVHRLTKQALFLPTTDSIMSEEVAQLYFKNVFESPRTSHPIGALSSFPISSVPSVRSSASDYTSHPATTRRPMARPNA